MTPTLTDQALEEKPKDPALQEMLTGLPHRYRYDWYSWAWDFYKSQNKMTLLLASNQSGKSTCQIRKVIEWAGNKKLWPILWPKGAPKVFWYLYPDADTATAEFENKWTESLPTGKFKDHPEFGWRVQRGDKRVIDYIEFNSGVRVYFKFYSQKAKNLQSGTVHAMFCFVAGTLVLTPLGAVPIESLSVGDKVVAGDGSMQTVLRALSREASVITRQFSNGESVTCTADHPFWTKNRGWVFFGDLTPLDQCGTVPGWNLIKRLSCLTASFSTAIQSIRTSASKIISRIVLADLSMLSFGRHCMGRRSQMTPLSTISTSIPWTIALRTSRCSPAPSILDSIKRKNGSIRANGSLNVSAAGYNLNLAAHRSGLPGIVHIIAAALGKSVNVLSAVLLSRLVANVRNASVLRSAPIGGSTRVYNLEVSGPHTYFAQGLRVHNCDEELPEEYYSELQARLFATDGYFHMVFTATLNQDFWKLAMEGDGDQEKFPDALKLQVSMRDCITYRNGRPGAFTEERIKRIEASCKSETERLRRVEGRFITEGGRKCAQYDSLRHLKTPFSVPADWRRYVGIDLGSGGRAHPPAISFIAVRPDCRFGVVYKGWIGDDGSTYTAGDVFNKFLSLRGNDLLVIQSFDQQAKDFGTIAGRAGETFMPSDKSQERGEDTMNTLFKNDMLILFDTPEIQKLGSELSTLMKSTPKKKARDNFYDSTRYCAMAVPWDWSMLKGDQTEDQIKEFDTRPFTDDERVAMEIDERRGELVDSITGRNSGKDQGWDEMDAEFTFWQEFATG